MITTTTMISTKVKARIRRLAKLEILEKPDI
jgi:hypothetical protein